ncbi:unnamed protein product, partial [Polarella glacialis]
MRTLRGFNLGGAVLRIGRHNAYVAGFPDREKLLQELGFIWDSQDLRFTQQLLPALQMFKDWYGHLNVPFRFVIQDSPDMPALLKEFKLGKVVNQVRSSKYLVKNEAHRLQILDQLGFVWDSEEFNFQEFIIPALEWYRHEFGDLLVPLKYELPESDPLPKLLWGFKFGAAVNKIRSRQEYVKGRPDRQKVLDELGLICEAIPDLEKSMNELGLVGNPQDFIFTQQLLPALRIFRDRHGHSNVPVSFVIQYSTDTPVLLRGFQLGRVVSQIRSSKYLVKNETGRLHALDELGFVWDSEKFKFQELIIPALEWYRREFGNLSVPLKYELPESDPLPKLLWGFKLGAAVNKIRSRQGYVKGRPDRQRVLDELGLICEASPDRKKSMKELGHVGKPQDIIFTQQLLPALQMFRDWHGHLNVPVRFIMPESQDIPTLLQGFPLGLVTNQIRSYKYLVKNEADRLHALEKLGFVWNSLDFTFHEKIVVSLEWYKRTFGNLLVPLNYELPEVGPTPKLLWGFKLGAAVNKIRSRQDYVKGRPDRQKVLEELGFAWERK